MNLLLKTNIDYYNEKVSQYNKLAYLYLINTSETLNRVPEIQYNSDISVESVQEKITALSRDISSRTTGLFELIEINKNPLEVKFYDLQEKNKTLSKEIDGALQEIEKLERMESEFEDLINLIHQIGEAADGASERFKIRQLNHLFLILKLAKQRMVSGEYEYFFEI